MASKTAWKFEFSILEIIKKHIKNVFLHEDWLLGKQGVNKEKSGMADIPKITSVLCIISRKIREKGNSCEGKGKYQPTTLLLLICPCCTLEMNLGNSLE